MKKFIYLMLCISIIFIACDIEGTVDTPEFSENDDAADDSDSGDQSSEWDGNIDSIEDLIRVADGLSGDYVLTCDLDFNDPGSYESGVVDISLTSGEGFQPIGSYATFENQDAKFSGSFDGQNYTISNLYINRPDESFVGLFGAAGVTSRIHNLVLENPIVTGDGLVGAVIGRLDDYYEGDETGSIILELCSVTGAVITGDSNTGGLVGKIYSSYDLDILLSGCVFQGTIDGGSYTGGIVGDIDAGLINFSSCTVQDGSSVSGDDYTGGLAGRLLHLGSMTESHNLADVSGGLDTGGAVGFLYGEDDTSLVSDSLSTGDVTLNGQGGGFIGRLRNASVINCHNTGNVMILESGGTSYGGFIGYINYDSAYYDDDNSRISNCSSTGTVNSDISGIIGSFIGLAYMSVEDCYTTGSIDSVSSSQIGGFIAGTSRSVKNCYTTGSVIGINGVTIGGFAGQLGSDGSIENCIAFGDSIGSGTAENINANLFVGSSLGNLSQIYVNDNMTMSFSVSAVPNGDAGTDLSSAEFINSASTVYSTWDFTSTWTITPEGPELQDKLTLLASLE
ncbi:MAG: hypothetical protein JEZ04_09590 [Spirochaetales bacterium]|nr:hypothetical protein [Spirochaetales bacterium]